MSQRDWVPSAPVGVGIAVVLLLTLAGILGEEQKYAECRAGRADKDCEQVISRAARAVGAPVVTPETPARKPQPDRDEWRAEQTIQAQWDQVAWAFWSAFAAWTAVVVGAVGILFVKRTLDATRDAVEQSARATDAAVDASKATREAVALSLRSFGLMHRPRLRVRNVTIPKLVVGEPITVEGEVANIGDTNALVFVTAVSVHVRRDKSGILRDKPEPQHIGTASYSTEEGRPITHWAPAGGRTPFSLKTDLICLNESRFNIEGIVVRGTILYGGTYPGDPTDLILNGKTHRSVERKTAFERFFTGDIRDGVPYRFVRAEKPDPEREYED